MNLAARPLALTFPLHGSRLIEASAGTGKTYTISALYLRLILGHGGELAFHESLLPPQILVVTFTDAATRELRDRIRTRLVEAAAVFRGHADGDDLLQALRDDFAPETHADCAQRLDIAAQWMDEAAVSTIHAWCQRMLREHAFDSGCLFNQTLQTDENDLLAEVVRDYWRLSGYPLSGPALAWVGRCWGTPEGLLKQLRPLLRDGGHPQVPETPLQDLLDSALEQRARTLADLKARWLPWTAELLGLLEGMAARKQVNGRRLQPRFFRSWMAKLGTWCGGDEEVLDLSETAFSRLTPEGLAEVWTDSTAEPPAHAALEAMRELPGQLAALPDPRPAALMHAAAWVRHRFDTEKRRRAEMGFDDMLTRLDDALESPADPETEGRMAGGGTHLAEVIRRQFPIALIDEFQDTDPLQYRIFDRIYQVGSIAQDRGLFLIGDPKQAIYAFRGADIHTYLRARRATAGRHYHLDTNFRSSEAMVEAVNHLFEQAEQRPEGRGAFLFREEGQDRAASELPFHPARAQGRQDAWTVDEETQTALTFWRLDTSAPLPKKTYVRTCAHIAASEIVRLLTLGEAGRAGFMDRKDGLKPLRPSDMAVLVRDTQEAQAIRDALAARGVRSVYLSDKDSVFASPEAGDLLLWLRACAEPDRDPPLRAALASATLALGLETLEQLNLDERCWEQRVMQFRSYRQIWREQGVLPMVHQLLQDFELPQRLLGQPDGERRLTNLLHLAELLQQAAAELDGELALIRDLDEQVHMPGQAADELVLRLESDAARVRVVTIHKSKGLEYPLVFLPFACTFRPVDGQEPVCVHDGDHRRLILQPDDDAVELAQRERLAEDLRLLYVALTRARHACWIGVADVRIGQSKASRLHESALGYLLDGGEPLAQSAALNTWLAPFEDAPRSQVLPAPEPDAKIYRPTDSERTTPTWRESKRTIAENWWIASYSALKIASGGIVPVSAPGQRQDDTAPESASAAVAGDDERPELASTPLPAAAQGVHAFPRGPLPGTFLHGLLEMAAAEGFGSLSQAPQTLQDLIARRCQRRGLSSWVEILTSWMQAMLNAPLQLGDGPGDRRTGGTAVELPPAASRSGDLLKTSLAELVHYQPELEFWFQATQVDVATLDALLRRHEVTDAERAPLLPDVINGMFKGFIDLTFEHEGRYYVIDYKSNWLGPDDAAYTSQAMSSAMTGHRYDLQAALYVLAIHRQLKLRLPDYDYDLHLGGVLYLFIRSPERGQYAARPPRELIEAMDALFQGHHEAPAA